jgi:hypothetical protein
MTRADAASSRRRAWPWVALLAVLVLAIALSVGIVGAGPAADDAAAAAGERRAAQARITVQAPDRERAAAGAIEEVAEKPAPDPEARARRDRARTRILEALARRDATPPPTRDDASDPSRPASGTIEDRIGGRDALVAALDDDFMPLADECIADARARDPSLQGVLAIELSVIADEEIGAVVDTVDFPASGEVHDALLHECIRETTLSTILPPPPEGGREGFLLTLNVDPD